MIITQKKQKRLNYVGYTSKIKSDHKPCPQVVVLR